MIPNQRIFVALWFHQKQRLIPNLIKLTQPGSIDVHDLDCVATSQLFTPCLGQAAFATVFYCSPTASLVDWTEFSQTSTSDRVCFVVSLFSLMNPNAT